MKKAILLVVYIFAIISCSKDNEVAAPYISVTESTYEVSAYGETVSVSVMSNVVLTVFADSWMELKVPGKSMDAYKRSKFADYFSTIESL